jgi:hypothetical protein
MLGFRSLSVAKRKPQSYNQVHPRDLEDGEVSEKRYDSSDDSDVSSPASSSYSSRASSGAYDANPNNPHEHEPTRGRHPSRL